MNSIVILIITISVIDCQSDICSVINTNNRAIEQFGVYRNLIWVNQQIKGSYQLYANGQQWQFSLDIDKNNRSSSANITFDESSVQTLNPELSARFCTNFTNKRGRPAVLYPHRYCCDVLEHQKNNSEIDCCCEPLKQKVGDGPHFSERDIVFFFSNWIVFNPKAGQYYRDLDSVVMLLERKSRNKLFYKHTAQGWQFLNEDENSFCKSPKFIKTIDPNLIIAGITDYDFGDKRKGHLIIFYVNGIYKYCITSEGKKLSESCKPKNLNTLAEHCYDVKPTQVTTQITSVPPKMETFTFVIILIIAAIFLALFTITGIYLLTQKKEKKLVLKSKSKVGDVNKSLIGKMDSDVNWNIKVSSDSTTSVP